ncbi:MULTISPECIES: restriction endonuclease subunit S [Flavobacterium]|uniref:restriction endonuclease subunit S n=1 Tax=Flavobacterium TaxID=237 RepID=UPI0015B327AB|nr:MULTISPECIES: restriction endonuclease subunit S [Flavobacterium]
MLKLENLCSIRSGQTFKRSWNDYDKGDIIVLQPKDIADGEPSKEILMISEYEIPYLNKHLLQKGDIVLVNRGTRFNSWMYNGTPAKMVVTTAFYVITLNTDKILPEFFNWYLGQQEVKDYFDLNATGTTIRGINKKSLMELPVPNIPLKLQKHIVELVEKTKEEQRLLSELKKIRKTYVENYIWEQIRNY